MNRACVLLVTILVLISGCASVGAGDNIISFVETNSAGQRTRDLAFELTSQPAETCIAGNWKRANAVHDRGKYTRKSAYTLEDGRLEVLLINEMCDSYDSYVGQLSNGVFTGDHVAYGLGFSESLGKVTGQYSEK